MNKTIKFPRVGQRILRSVSAVCLCFVVYYIRGCKGIPFYSALAVLQCMQPYRDRTIEIGKKRTIGTLIGAFWGFLVILIQIYALDKILIGSFLNYMLISVFTGIVIYSTVILNCKNNSYFSCVVFLSITVMHISDTNPVGFVMNRVFDTMIGVVLAMIVNAVHLPRGKNTDVLYVSGIEDVLLSPKEKLSDYSKVELNRIIKAGANFTVSTIRTPASVRETLRDIDLKLPIIAMDGAVLYDMKENVFLMSYKMSYRQAAKVIQILSEERVNYFTNVVVDDMLVIYYEEARNHAEQKMFEEMRKSPYRNYVRRPLPEGESVVYFMMIDQDDKIQALYERLKKKIQPDEYKMISYCSNRYPGYSYIKIYHKDATREHMLQNLCATINIEKTITFGSIPGKCDVLIKDFDRNTMVKELKKRFEPVKWQSAQK